MTAGNTRRVVTQSQGVTKLTDPDTVEATSMIAFTDGDTTPSVVGGKKFRTANTAATAITNFDDVTDDGYEITVFFGDDLTSITHGANIDMPGASSRDFITGDIFKFMMRSSCVSCSKFLTTNYTRCCISICKSNHASSLHCIWSVCQ